MIEMYGDIVSSEDRREGLEIIYSGRSSMESRSEVPTNTPRSRSRLCFHHLSPRLSSSLLFPTSLPSRDLPGRPGRPGLPRNRSTPPLFLSHV